MVINLSKACQNDQKLQKKSGKHSFAKPVTNILLSSNNWAKARILGNTHKVSWKFIYKDDKTETINNIIVETVSKF